MQTLDDIDPLFWPLWPLPHFAREGLLGLHFNEQLFKGAAVVVALGQRPGKPIWTKAKAPTSLGTGRAFFRTGSRSVCSFDDVQAIGYTLI